MLRRLTAAVCRLTSCGHASGMPMTTTTRSLMTRSTAMTRPSTMSSGAASFAPLRAFAPATTVAPPPSLTLLHQLRTFRVKNAIKRQCEHCYIRRKKNKKWYVYCTANPRHKQRQL